MSINGNKTYNLKQLLKVLGSTSDITKYPTFFNNMLIRYEDIEHLCFWDYDKYSKINLDKGSNYELILMCWEKGQKSSVHDHKEKEELLYVIKGELTEETTYPNLLSMNKSQSTKNYKLSCGKISHIVSGNQKKHKLINSNNGKTVSLHLYIK